MRNTTCRNCQTTIPKTSKKCPYCGTENKFYKEPKNNQNKIKATIRIIVIMAIFFPIICTAGIFHVYNIPDKYTDGSPENKYYISKDEDIYYNLGHTKYEFETEEGYIIKENYGYEWWKYNKYTNDWKLFDNYEEEYETPRGVSYKNNYDSAEAVKKALNLDSNLDLNINHSKNFIDAGNNPAPEMGYYYINHEYYYYLEDNINSYKENLTGWYKYIEDFDEWTYVCKRDEKEKLGNDLWYKAYEYYSGKIIEDIYDMLEKEFSPVIYYPFENSMYYFNSQEFTN